MADRGGMTARRRAWEVLSEFRRDNRGDTAAALTYYGVLALFPSLLMIVALIGLLGRHPQTTNELLDLVDRVGPASAVETFRGTIEGVVRDSGGAAALLGLGALGWLYSSTGYLDAFFRAASDVHGVPDDRGFLRRKPLQIGLALGLGLAVAVLGVLVVVTGPLAEEVGDAVGAGDAAVTAWGIAKWPVAVLVAVAIIGVLFRVAPDVRRRPWRPITVGAATALAIWVPASVGFGFYVANFGSYNATYGALGGVIVFLIWLWLTNVALILGLIVDAQLEGAADGTERRATRPAQPPAGGQGGDSPPGTAAPLTPRDDVHVRSSPR